MYHALQLYNVIAAIIGLLGSKQYCTADQSTKINSPKMKKILDTKPAIITD